MQDHVDGGGGQEVRREPCRHHHQAGRQLQGGRQCAQDRQGLRVQVHEQRGN